MASLFRARRTEGRSGGKILRGRRAAPAASPYARPQSPTPLPSPSHLHEQSVSPKWLSGLISGAGKLISSVFGSDGGCSSSSSSSGYSSDEDASLSSNKEKDADRSQGNLQESNKGTELIRGHSESKAIVPISDTKHAIEELLMQETFSRDECDKLVKIIESRVVDLSSVEVIEYRRAEDISTRTTDSAGIYSGAWHSSSKNSDLLGSIPYSTGRLSALSPSSRLQASPGLCNTAVMEAKKWLEEKKLQSSSSSRPDKCGPCTLNTEMLEYGFEGEVGSPVDLAKSYMQSLPPWQSPFISTVGFKTPSPSGMHLYKDEAIHASSNYSLPLSKVLKRNYLSTDLWDASEESRRVCLRSSENLLDSPKFRQACSSTRLFENGSLKILSADDGKGQEALGTHQYPSSLEPIEPSGATLKLSNELTVDDPHSHGALRLSDEIAPQTEQPQIDSIIPSSKLSGLKESVTTVKQSDISSLPTSVTLEHIHTETESGPKSLGLDDISDERNDVMESSQNEKRNGNKALLEHAGENLSEAKVVTSEIRYVLPSDADNVNNSGDKNIPTSDKKTVADLGGILEGNISSDIKLDSSVKEIHSVADSRLHDSDTHLKTNANGLPNKISTNGSSAQLNANSYIESSINVEPSNTNSSNDVIADSCVLVSAALLNNPAVHETNEISRQLQNGTKTKSMEHTEHKTITARRGRKRVVKAGRGK